MAAVGRNLIALSDGTGNSASKLFKTNVWRLYQGLDLRDGSQVAMFGDGVGTSSVKVLRALGLALGIGVKRNVLNLYKFLCRNYDGEDRIWMFGFSRGAFTVRVLAGLIYCEGLASYDSEAELNRNAVAAYRAYRRKVFATYIPWVLVGRFLRDRLVLLWNALTGARSYNEVKKETARLGRGAVQIHFLGVWDTVVAYGLPIDELTVAVDKWVWPMKFRDRSLLANVENARHALSLDDERRTFHPVPWDEGATETRSPDGRLEQVWFAGMHADVGGGYPDDGLSFVPLCWMIGEAASKGLRFEPTVVAEYTALASPTGRIYDSRAGSGVLWRYQPRDAQLLLGHGIIPLVHGSVMTRMARGNDGYAPISLPEEIGVVLPDGSTVPFKKTDVQQELNNANAAAAAAQQLAGDSGAITAEHLGALHDQQRVLQHALELLDAAPPRQQRSDFFKLVLDTVWWRRVVYFVTLILVLIAAVFPLLAQYLRFGRATDRFNDIAEGSVGWTLGMVKGFLPSFLEAWLTTVRHYPAQAAVISVGILASLGLSNLLQGRICDRARAAWNLRSRGGLTISRLAPTGQRHALIKAAIVLIVFAAGLHTLGDEQWWARLFAGLGLLLLVWWGIRRFRPAKIVDPAKPNPLLRIARVARTSQPAVAAYRFTARTLAPMAFLVLGTLLIASLAHRTAFDLLSAAGNYCTASSLVREQSTARLQPQITAGTPGSAAFANQEILGQAKGLFLTSAMCHATGLRLIADRQYRITLDIGEELADEWFDKGRRTDVSGFTADSLRHVLASPLKRWWRENWFQPIVRIGEVGNNEHVLRPVAPLSEFRTTDASLCPAAAKEREEPWSADVESPASDGFKRAQIACDDYKTDFLPTRRLISDITADATGELFLYVNDAVLLWPEMTSRFYRNNSGRAAITVDRIVGTPVITTSK